MTFTSHLFMYVRRKQIKYNKKAAAEEEREKMKISFVSIELFMYTLWELIWNMRKIWDRDPMHSYTYICSS